MFCPSCGLEQICGCENCVKAHPARAAMITWRNLEHDAVACGRCGFTQHIDWWEDLSIQIATHKATTKAEGETE